MWPETTCRRQHAKFFFVSLGYVKGVIWKGLPTPSFRALPAPISPSRYLIFSTKGPERFQRIHLAQNLWNVLCLSFLSCFSSSRWYGKSTMRLAKKTHSNTIFTNPLCTTTGCGIVVISPLSWIHWDSLKIFLNCWSLDGHVQFPFVVVQRR